MALKRVVIIGAGGLAREVRWILDEINADHPTYDWIGYVVSDLSRLTERDSRDHLLGDFAWLDEHRRAFDALILGFAAPMGRIQVAAELRDRYPDISFPAVIHPSVHLGDETVQVGEGVLLHAGAVAPVNITLEPFVVVNTLCTLGHEAHLGRGSVVNPAANIAGGVRLGEGVLVGAGAQVLQYLEVGDGATIGAGAVVTRSVAPGQTVVGVPARPIAP